MTLTHKKEQPCIVFPADLNPKRLLPYTSSKQLLYFILCDIMCITGYVCPAHIYSSFGAWVVYRFGFMLFLILLFEGLPFSQHRDEVESTVENGRRARMLLETL